MKRLKYLIALIVYLVSHSLAYSGENSTYDFRWLDPEKKIYVLQNKLFEKKNTFNLSVGYGINMSNDFQDANSVLGKGQYFFTEEWGVELLYAFVTNKDSDTLRAVSITPGNVIPFIRKVEDYYGGALIYYPFYAKLNTFNKIFYLDWGFGAGAAKLDTKSNRKAFKNRDRNLPFESESFTGYFWETELRAYITDYMNLNINYIHIYFQDKNPTTDKKEFFSNTDLVFSLGFNI